MLRTVHLHGSLSEQFGSFFAFDTVDAAETVRALCANFRAFRGALRRGAFRMVIRRPVTGEEIDISREELRVGLGFSELHIYPVIHGAKQGSGIAKVIIGVVIIAAAFVTAGAALGAAGALAGGAGGFGLGATALGGLGIGLTWGNVAMIGLSIALAGVSQLLAPQPKDQTGPIGREAAANRPSASFNGAVNNTEQGHPVPWVYGRMRTGSIVGSGGISTEDISPTMDNSGTIIPPVEV